MLLSIDPEVLDKNVVQHLQTNFASQATWITVILGVLSFCVPYLIDKFWEYDRTNLNWMLGAICLGFIFFMAAFNMAINNYIDASHTKTYTFSHGYVTEYKIFANASKKSEYVYEVYKYGGNSGFSQDTFQYKYISKVQVTPHADVIK